MVQCLRAWAAGALPEGRVQVPAPTDWLTTANSSFRGPDALFWPPCSPLQCGADLRYGLNTHTGVWWHTPLILGQEDLCDFETKLIYTVSSGTGNAM